MKCLSIKQPWASLIAHGIKPIENRAWRTNYRGTILIHASIAPAFNNLTLNLSHDQIDAICKHKELFSLDTRSKFYPKSAIIGQMDIIDCGIGHTSIWADKAPICPETGLHAFTIYNWVLENAILYDEPILNVKGKLSLWEFNPY